VWGRHVLLHLTTTIGLTVFGGTLLLIYMWPKKYLRYSYLLSLMAVQDSFKRVDIVLNHAGGVQWHGEEQCPESRHCRTLVV
jgi:hypothetical protein